MKNLLAMFMCFQFIVAPVITMTPSSAWAETDEEKAERLEKENEALRKQVLEQAQIASQEAANGSESNKYREGGEEAGAGADFFAQQVLMIATSCIGANILISCAMGSMQQSLYVYMAGSFVHIASEILGAKAINEHHKRSAKNLALKMEELQKAAGDGSLQKEAVEAMLQEEKNTLEFIKSRKRWMNAIVTVYWVAVAVALYEIWRELPEPIGPFISSIGACGPVIPLYSATAAGISAAYGYGMSQNAKDPFVKWGTPILAVMNLIPSVGSLVTATYNHAIPRAITFGVTAGIATYIRVKLGDKEAEIANNITKLNQLLADGFKDTTTNDAPTVEVDTTNTSTSNSNLASSDYESNAASDTVATLPRHCGKSSSTTGTTYSEDCSSPLKFNPITFDSKFGSPIPNDISSQVTGLADATSSGDTAKASVLAAELASNAGRMRAIAEKMMDDLNGKLKKAGKKEIDFKGEMKNKMAAMIQDYNKSAASNMGASLASGKAVLDAEVPAAAAATPTGKMASKAAGAATGLDPLKGFESGTATFDPNAAGANSPGISETLEQFESNENDINKQNDVSIFSLISNRYVLSYERVLKKKEAPKAEAPASVNLSSEAKEADKK